MASAGHAVPRRRGIGDVFAQPPQQAEQHSIYDATKGGTRAAYLLLEDLGYPVKPSRRFLQGRVRWVLFPSKNADKAGPAADWVRDGGVLVLADDDGAFARAIGLEVSVSKEDSSTIEVPLDDTAKVHLGTVVVTGPAGTKPLPRAWPAGADKPLASVYRLGRGEVWLLNRPQMLRNDQLRAAWPTAAAMASSCAGWPTPTGPTRPRPSGSTSIITVCVNGRV